MSGVLEMACKRRRGCVMSGVDSPVRYQLVKKPDGVLVLQGYFVWSCDQCSSDGGEWRDLPTIVMPQQAPETRWQKLQRSLSKWLPKPSN